MTMGRKGKSNLIQQTHVLIHFVRKALLGTEEGKETEMNEAEVFLQGARCLVGERVTKDI